MGGCKVENPASGSRWLSLHSHHPDYILAPLYIKLSYPFWSKVVQILVSF